MASGEGGQSFWELSASSKNEELSQNESRQVSIDDLGSIPKLSDVLLGQLSKQLCADLRSALHDEFQGIVADQAKAAANLMECIQAELKKPLHNSFIVSEGSSEFGSSRSPSPERNKFKMPCRPSKAHGAAAQDHLFPSSAEATSNGHQPRESSAPMLPGVQGRTVSASEEGQNDDSFEPRVKSLPLLPVMTKYSGEPSGQESGQEFHSSGLTFPEPSASFATSSHTLSSSASYAMNCIPQRQLMASSHDSQPVSSGSTFPEPSASYASGTLSSSASYAMNCIPERQVDSATASPNLGCTSVSSTSKMARPQSPKKKTKQSAMFKPRTDSVAGIEDLLSKEIFAAAALKLKPGGGDSPQRDGSLKQKHKPSNWQMSSVIPAGVLKRRHSETLTPPAWMANSALAAPVPQSWLAKANSFIPSGMCSPRPGSPPELESPPRSPERRAAKAFSLNLPRSTQATQAEAPVGLRMPADDDGTALAETSSVSPQAKYAVPAEQAEGEDDASFCSVADDRDHYGFQTTMSSPMNAQSSLQVKLEGLREMREAELTQQLTHAENARIVRQALSQPDQDGKTPFGVSLVDVSLRMCGVLPWSNGMSCQIYPWLVILVAMLALWSCVQQFVQHKWIEASHEGNYSCDIALALGASVVLICSRAFHKEIYECNALIVSYASNQDFLEIWAQGSSWDAAGTFTVWVVAVLERCRHFSMSSHADTEGIQLRAALHVSAFVFASAVILIWMHYIQYVARFLACMVDTFVCRFVGCPDFAEAITDWNVLQAVIRKSCRCIQSCFFVLQTTMAVAGLFSMIAATSSEKGEFMVFVPAALIIVAVIRVFFCAGAVTDKCARVPALVNSLNVGTVLDRDRLYVVEYISHSQAGFYMFEVRVTSAVVMKLFYFSCIVAVTVATRVVAVGE